MGSSIAVRNNECTLMIAGQSPESSQQLCKTVMVPEGQQPNVIESTLGSAQADAV